MPFYSSFNYCSLPFNYHQYRSNIDWPLIRELAKAPLNHDYQWQALNAWGQQKWRWVRTEMGKEKEKRINVPMRPFNEKMAKLWTRLNTVEWGGGYFNVAGHDHRNIRSSAATTLTAICCYSVYSTRFWHLWQKRNCEAVPVLQTGCNCCRKKQFTLTRKRFRSSTLLSEVKISWKLKNCDRPARLLLCTNVYS